MSASLNNVTTQNDWSTACTLDAGQPCIRINLDISNAAIYYDFGRRLGSSGGIVWDGRPTFSPPSFKALDRRFNAVRVKSAAAGKPAQVTITALSTEDIPS